MPRSARRSCKSRRMGKKRVGGLRSRSQVKRWRHSAQTRRHGRVRRSRGAARSRRARRKGGARSTWVGRKLTKLRRRGAPAATPSAATPSAAPDRELPERQPSFSAHWGQEPGDTGSLDGQPTIALINKHEIRGDAFPKHVPFDCPEWKPVCRVPLDWLRKQTVYAFAKIGKTSKWRRAKVTRIISPTQLEVYFCGWTDNENQVIDDLPNKFRITENSLPVKPSDIDRRGAHGLCEPDASVAVSADQWRTKVSLDRIKETYRKPPLGTAPPRYDNRWLGNPAADQSYKPSRDQFGHAYYAAQDPNIARYYSGVRVKNPLTQEQLRLSRAQELRGEPHQLTTRQKHALELRRHANQPETVALEASAPPVPSAPPAPADWPVAPAPADWPVAPTTEEAPRPPVLADWPVAPTMEKAGRQLIAE